MKWQSPTGPALERQIIGDQFAANTNIQHDGNWLIVEMPSLNIEGVECMLMQSNPSPPIDFAKIQGSIGVRQTRRIISPDVDIDTETDWGDIDHVLIGTPEDLMGVLCVSDVFSCDRTENRALR